MSNAGDLDLTFGPDGSGLVITDFSNNNTNDLAYSVVIDNNNKIVVAGYSNANGTNDFALARYNNSGILDTTFGINGLVITDFSNNSDDVAQSVVIDNSNNKIVVAGYTYNNGFFDFALARYDNSGNLDTTFGPDGTGKVITNFSNNTSDDQAYSVVIDNNNKIVVAGYTNANGTSDFALARYDNSGNLDTTFGINGNGLVITDFSNNSNDRANSVVIDNNNKIVVAGSTIDSRFRDFALARYDNSGILDTTFGINGLVITDFSNNRNDVANSVVIYDNNNNKIVVAGYTNANGTNDFALARYDNLGNLDLSFGPDGNGKVITYFSNNSNDQANSVVIDNINNKIVVAGYTNANGNSDFALARYDNSGNLDTTFGINENGLVITDFSNNTDNRANSVVIDNNNKIVVAGFTENSEAFISFALARYLSEDIPPSPSPPISNICFVANTPIRTDQGIIPIEEIIPDRHTIRNKKIIAITQTITVDKYLVCFEKNAIGKNIPSEKTIVSKNHLIFNKGEMITAKDFITKYKNVYKVKYKGEILYNVLLEHHDKMVVNNLICETLDPENMIAKLFTLLPNYNLQEQSQIIKKYNHIVNKKFKLLAQKKN
jgi:uncharacterized delta-60 repeat protein